MRLFIFICASMLFSASCYHSARPEDDDGGASEDSGGLPDPDAEAWSDGNIWWPETAPRDVGPVCPGDIEILEIYECDIFEQDCESGLACYGWTEYTPDPCVREIYRSGCFEPGLGEHGDPCDMWCLPGLECFVTGEGTQCLYICDILGGDRQCPPGMLCVPTDQPNVGACT